MLEGLEARMYLAKARLYASLGLRDDELYCTTKAENRAFAFGVNHSIQITENTDFIPPLIAQEEVLYLSALKGSLHGNRIMDTPLGKVYQEFSHT